jgi:hypothetical protein
MYLQQKDPSELNALERRLLEMVDKQSISYFPLGRALCIPEREEDEEVGDKVSSYVTFLYDYIVFLT